MLQKKEKGKESKECETRVIIVMIINEVGVEVLENVVGAVLIAHRSRISFIEKMIMDDETTQTTEETIPTEGKIDIVEIIASQEMKEIESIIGRIETIITILEMMLVEGVLVLPP
jgi:hypothetical protein